MFGSHYQAGDRFDGGLELVQGKVPRAKKKGGSTWLRQPTSGFTLERLQTPAGLILRYT